MFGKIIKNFSQFCPDHKDDTGPVVLAEHLSAETKAKLQSSRSLKNYAQGVKQIALWDVLNPLIPDNIFFIRSLVKYDRQTDMFLVRLLKSLEDLIYDISDL